MLFQNPHKRYHNVEQIIVCLLLVVATAAFAGGQSVDELLSNTVRPEPGPWTWNRPFDLSHIVILEPIGEISVGGWTTFRLAILQRTDSVSLTVNISKLSRLEYNGAMTWQISPKKGDTIFFSFPVRIPANDTAGMEVKVVNSSGKESEAACYIVTTIAIPKIWWFDPQLSDEYKLKHEPRQKFKHRQDDSLPKYMDSVLFHDDEGNIIGGDSAPKILDTLNRKCEPKGSDLVWHGTTWDNLTQITFDSLWKLEAAEKLVRELKEKEELEKEPRAELGCQEIVVDGKVLFRNQGERLFRPALTVEQVEDSIRQLRKVGDTLHYDASLDLRKPEDYAFASKLVDTLIPMESEGIYKARVNKSIMVQLQERGIKTALYPNLPGARSGVKKGRSNVLPDAFQSRASPDGLVTHFFSNFETGFDQWFSADSMPMSGLDTWGDDGEKPHQGYGSAWCAAIGDQYETYDTWMSADLKTIETIDLSSTTDNFIEVYVWYETEDMGDFFSIWQHHGDYAFSVHIFTGVSSGWIPIHIDLPDTVDNLGIFFHFGSDESVVMEGAYVDDIVVRGASPAAPNLRVSAPWGWSSPIVVSNQTNQTENPTGVVTAGVPAYINWSIVNSGDASSGASNSAIYVDGVYKTTVSALPLGPGAYDSRLHNISHTFSVGSHTIRVVADLGNSVAEEYEDDNSYQINITATNNRPNLVAYQPAQWDGPVVANFMTSNHVNGPLYANQTAYIDFAIHNSGTAAASAFRSRLYIDNNQVFDTVVSTLATAGDIIKDNFQTIQTQGNHIVKLVVDVNNDVAESSDSDNVFVDTFYWSSEGVSVEGRVYLKIPNGSAFPSYRQLPEGFLVELWDFDASGGDDLLASGQTLTLGLFELGPVGNLEEDGTRQDIYVRLSAITDHAQAGDSIDASYSLFPHRFYTDTLLNCTSGWHYWKSPGADIELTSTQSQFFFLSDVANRSMMKWNDLTGSYSLTPSKIILRSGIGGTGYRDTTLQGQIVDLIAIETSPQPNRWSPDGFDQDVLCHELGHRISYNHGFLRDGIGMTHFFTTISNPQFAAEEAWGNFWAATSANRDTIYDILGTYTDSMFFNLENGTYGRLGALNDSIAGTANSLGPNCEGSVAAALWDIYDANADDFSSRANWNQTSLPHSSDSIGDSMSVSNATLPELLVDRLLNGKHCQTFADIWDAWFGVTPSLGHEQAMLDVGYEHAIYDFPGCCVGVRGNVNMKGGIDLSDLAFLISYLTVTPQVNLPCTEEANVNGTGTIDLSDLSMLFGYMTLTPKPTLPNCP